MCDKIFKSFSNHFCHNGVNMSAMLLSVHFYLSNPRGLVVCGDKNDPETISLLEVARKDFHPALVTAFIPEGKNFLPLSEKRKPIDGRATAYVCIGKTCRLPVHKKNELRHQLKN